MSAPKIMKENFQVPRSWRPKMSPNQEMNHPEKMFCSISVEMLAK
jgi:hypothetical protein